MKTKYAEYINTLTPDQINARLRDGMLNYADAKAFCDQWNADGTKLHIAEVREMALDYRHNTITPQIVLI